MIDLFDHFKGYARKNPTELLIRLSFWAILLLLFVRSFYESETEKLYYQRIDSMVTTQQEFLTAHLQTLHEAIMHAQGNNSRILDKMEEHKEQIEAFYILRENDLKRIEALEKKCK